MIIAVNFPIVLSLKHLHAQYLLMFITLDGFLANTFLNSEAVQHCGRLTQKIHCQFLAFLLLKSVKCFTRLSQLPFVFTNNMICNWHGEWIFGTSRVGAITALFNFTFANSALFSVHRLFVLQHNRSWLDVHSRERWIREKSELVRGLTRLQQ